MADALGPIVCEACGATFGGAWALSPLTAEDRRVVAHNGGWAWRLTHNAQGDVTGEVFRCRACLRGAVVAFTPKVAPVAGLPFDERPEE